MADYVYCLHSPSLPGLIRIESSSVDPYSRDPECWQRLRLGLRDYGVAWAVRVVDGLAAEAAVKQALASFAHDDESTFFRCDPMAARAEAIRVTTLRSSGESGSAPERRSGWLSRLGRSGGKGHAA